MKRFLLKKVVFFKYSYFICNKLVRLSKKKWSTYKKINYKHYLNAHKFYRYDFIKIKRLIMAIKKNFKHLLINKQWIKHFYGGLKNNTFKSFFFLNKPFVSVIESRLDLAIFRTNLLTNVLTIRSLIAHRKIKLNNKIVTRPSLQLKQGDIVNISTFGKFKINRFVPLYLETSYKLRTFTFLKVLEENLKFFLLFIFKDLHFYKTYNYFISHKKS